MLILPSLRVGSLLFKFLLFSILFLFIALLFKKSKNCRQIYNNSTYCYYLLSYIIKQLSDVVMIARNVNKYYNFREIYYNIVVSCIGSVTYRCGHPIIELFKTLHFYLRLRKHIHYHYLIY